MLDGRECILYSGAAEGAEAEFGRLAEAYGVREVNYTFDGHRIQRTRGVHVLTDEELALKDVSLTYVSRLMNRVYSRAPMFRKILQSICWQVASGREVFVVGNIQEDGTVRGGTGWGAEYAKIRNKPLYVFDQDEEQWFVWGETGWEAEDAPVVTRRQFTGTGASTIGEAGRGALAGLFKRSFLPPSAPDKSA